MWIKSGMKNKIGIFAVVLSFPGICLSPKLKEGPISEPSPLILSLKTQTQNHAQQTQKYLGKDYLYSIKVHQMLSMDFQGPEQKSLEESLVKKIVPQKYKKLAPQIAKTIKQESRKHRFDPFFVMAVINNESGFRPYVKGGVGEIGLMQIRPQTAKWFTKKFNLPYRGKKSLYNPRDNIRIGLAYLAYLRQSSIHKKGDFAYLAAYNMGPKRVREVIKKHKKVPQTYSNKVLVHYKYLYRKLEKFHPPLLASLTPSRRGKSSSLLPLSPQDN
ncbi:MAG: lytic transglycosylase domain-containing protein [Bacteriovoracales bacterium]|nr:lytic transglycosylase domain-containing protein [Bacteriovoracales bacterium]